MCWPATSWVHYTTSCNTQSSAPEDGENICPKHVELTGIINKPLLLHLVGCLYYLYQWCTVKQISDNEVYLLIKHIKSVLWRVAKRLSYIQDARCVKVNSYTFRPKLYNYICVGLQIVGHSNPPEIKKKREKHLIVPFLSGTHKFALFGSRAQEGPTSSLPILIEMRTWRSGKWAALMRKLKTSITHPFSVSSEVEIRNITYRVSTFTSFTESSSCFRRVLNFYWNKNTLLPTLADWLHTNTMLH